MWLAYQLDSSPIQVATNSTVGSQDVIHLHFRKNNDLAAGTIEIKFSDPPAFSVGYCLKDWHRFLMPDAVSHVWTISKTFGNGSESNTKANSVVIHCDNIVVTEFVFSEASNSSKCEAVWSRGSQKMRFSDEDTASREYRPRPPTPDKGGWLKLQFKNVEPF